MARKGRRWEYVLSTKPAEVVQEACQVLEKHGCPVKELKSELYYRTLCQCVFQVVHNANLIVAHAPTAWTALLYIHLNHVLNNAYQILVRPHSHACSHVHICTCTYPHITHTVCPKVCPKERNFGGWRDRTLLKISQSEHFQVEDYILQMKGKPHPYTIVVCAQNDHLRTSRQHFGETYMVAVTPLLSSQCMLVSLR